MMRFSYFVRRTGLLAEWGRTTDQKVVAVHGSPGTPTQLY
jgi:hypothetical protein